MLKEGYSNAEVAQEMGITFKRAHSLAVKCHIKAKPKFKYQVTITKTGQLIYSGNYQNFSILMHHIVIITSEQSDIFTKKGISWSGYQNLCLGENLTTEINIFQIERFIRKD